MNYSIVETMKLPKICLKEKLAFWQKLSLNQKISFVFLLLLLISVPLSLLVALNPVKFFQRAQAPTEVQVETPPWADSFIAVYNPDDNYGSQGTFEVSRYGSDLKKGLLKFNLSGIPINSIITSAKLKLQAISWSGSKGTIDIYKVVRLWDENSVTWNKAGSTSWEKPGCLGTSDVISEKAASFAADYGTNEIDLRDLVNNWVANPAANQGIILVDTTDRTDFIFNSKESGNQPKLLITYTSSGLPPLIPTVIPSITPAPQGFRVFITSTTYKGNLGGLAGADAKCQERANAANLEGIWKAWLSDSTTSAASRLAHSSSPYKLLNGQIVANNWADLTDGSLAVPINVTEFNTTLGDERVWTYTNIDGSISNQPLTNISNGNCYDWTYSVSSDNSWGKHGWTTNNHEWTYGLGWKCDSNYHLYCFEQPSLPTSTPTPTPTSVPQGPVIKNFGSSRDSYIYIWGPDENYGGEGAFKVGVYGGSRYKGLLNFDLSSLPLNASISAASLTLNVSGWGGSNGNVDIYKILKSWNENEVTWSKATSATAWKSPGCSDTTSSTKDIEVTKYASLNVALGKNIVNLTSLVKSWQANPQTKNGLLLVATSANTTFFFDTKENSDATKRPKLTITYTLP